MLTKKVRSYNRDKGGVCTEEEKGISVVEGRKGRGVQVHRRTTEQRIH